MNSLFIAYENDESCHCVVRIGSPVLISFYCVCFISFYVFIFLFFVAFTTCLGIEVIEVNTSNKVVELFLDS